MNYVISILVMIILISIYVGLFYLNSKIKRPEICKEIDCVGCKINCNKRS